MIELRLCKVLIAASLALFADLVVIDNILDYGSNYNFVKHVLSMDTTFPDSVTHWRAITQPMRWHVAYGIIIFGEALTGAAYTIGSIALFRSLRVSGETFNRAKRFIYPATAFGSWCGSSHSW